MYVALSNLITVPDFGRVPTDVDCPHKSLNYVTFDVFDTFRYVQITVCYGHLNLDHLSDFNILGH